MTQKVPKMFSAYGGASKNFKRPASGIEDLIQNYTSVPPYAERMSLLIQAAVGAARDPTRADLVSTIGDLTAHDALKNI